MTSSKSQYAAVRRFASIQWQLHHFPCDERSTYPRISRQFENYVFKTFHRLLNNSSHHKARNAETPVRTSLSIAADSMAGASDGLSGWFGAALAAAEKSAALPNATISLSREALAQHNSELSPTTYMPPVNTPSSATHLPSASHPVHSSNLPVVAGAGATTTLPELPPTSPASSALSSLPPENDEADLPVPMPTRTDTPLNPSKSPSRKVTATKKRGPGSKRTKSKVQLGSKLQEGSLTQRKLRSASMLIQPSINHNVIIGLNSTQPIDDSTPLKSSRNGKKRKYNVSRPIAIPPSDEGLGCSPSALDEIPAVLGTPADPMDIGPSPLTTPTTPEIATHQSHTLVFGQTLALLVFPLIPDALFRQDFLRTIHNKDANR